MRKTGVAVLSALTVMLVCGQAALATPALSGRKAVSSAGTAERLSTTSTWCRELVVTAFEANTDVVVVGTASVVALEASRNGMVLFAGQTEYIGGGNTHLPDVWIDAEVNDEGASFSCNR